MRPVARYLLITAAAALLLFFLVQRCIETNREQKRQQQQEQHGILQTFAPQNENNNNQQNPSASSPWYSLLIDQFSDSLIHKEDGRFEPNSQGFLNYRLSPATNSASETTADNIHRVGSSRDWASAASEDSTNDSLTSKMNDDLVEGKSGQQQQRRVSVRNNVRCARGEYDRLIAQKIGENALSRPVRTSAGRFDNPFPTWNQASLVGVVQFMLEPSEANVPANKDELEKELPMIRPNFKVKKSPSTEFRVTWIGHSTLLIQVDGFNILTDPVFSERASPSQYFGPKRIRAPACDVKSLPRIDIVLISHNHYDHLDSNSVRQINDRFGAKCRWIVPLGLGEFLRSMYVLNYVELDWWQKDCFFTGTSRTSTTTTPPNSPPAISSSSRTLVLTSAKEISEASHGATATVNNKFISETDSKRTTRNERLELDVYLTPSQHWSRRGIADTNKSLWGSYTIVNKNGATFFFAGDSGYCSAFKEISSVFGPFTGAAIPIGAYKPRWFLKAQHVDPDEAVQVHKDLGSLKSIAIHHSTFVLSNEDYREPARLLREIMQEHRTNGTLKEPFIALKHGESAEFCRAC